MASPQVSSTGQVEPSEQDLRYGMFVNLDKRAREIEAQFKSTWSELADLCLTMRDCSYWKEGGFSSFNSWLISALPCSRSWAYLAIGIREELKELGDELKEIPLANADVLRKLPKEARTAPKTIKAAQTMTPAEFLPAVAAEHPQQALEMKFKLRYTITASQHKVMQQFFDGWRLLHEESQSEAEIIECVMVDWMLTHQAELEAASA